MLIYINYNDYGVLEGDSLYGVHIRYMYERAWVGFFRFSILKRGFIFTSWYDDISHDIGFRGEIQLKLTHFVG